MNSPTKPYSSNASTSDLKDPASSAVDSVRGAVGDAVDRGQTAMSQAGAKANEMADSASQQITTFASELAAMTRRNPLGTLAAATIAGVLVGLIMRGGGNRE
jgi:ElaB/YqjD/DUF883 family membrane-anchored ribosome-binding protein